MKTTLLLIPCALGLLFSGCAVSYDPATGQMGYAPAVIYPGTVVVEAPDAVYFTDAAGVPYYFVDGRYCYYRGGHRVFVDRLPLSGHINREYARHHAEFARNHEGVARSREGVAPVPAAGPARSHERVAGNIPVGKGQRPAQAVTQKEKKQTKKGEKSDEKQ